MPDDRKRFGVLPNLGPSLASVEFISAEPKTESYQKQDFIVLVLSIAVLVIELVALPQHSRFEHEHRFTEHEHGVFCQLPTNSLPSSLSRRSVQLKATKSRISSSSYSPPRAPYTKSETGP